MTRVIVSSSPGLRSESHVCVACNALEHPRSASSMWRHLATARARKLADPLDFATMVPKLREMEERYPPESLVSYSELLAERLAVSGQTAPDAVRSFMARHRPTPGADVRTRVRFVSARFSPRGPEDREVNPGRYGRELALWLSDGLHARGIFASPPLREDWGWLVEVNHSGVPISVGCGNVDDSRDQWLISLERQRRGLLDRLLGRGGDSPTALGAVVNAVDACLRAERSASGIEWHRVDEREREHDHAPHPA